MLKELECAIDCATNLRSHRRLNAIHMLLIGGTIDFVLKSTRVSKRTLSLWIKLFNGQGIDGLKTREPPGRTPSFTQELFKREVAPIIDKPAKAKERVALYAPKQLQATLS